MSSKIVNVNAFEILDSRGNLTIQVNMELASGCQPDFQAGGRSQAMGFAITPH